MDQLLSAFVLLLATFYCGAAVINTTELFDLPKDLQIGVGLAAFQVEGAWNEDGKAESNLDHLFHTNTLGTDPKAADTATDFYHRYKEDISLAAQLKFKVFRFSISWPRVLPYADASRPNKKGVEFYHNVIDEILAHNMTPMATVYHFDHPQILEDEFKGWMSEKMVPKFKEYAKFVFNEYGSKVKIWTTLNEPNVYCAIFLNWYHMAGLYTEEDTNNHYFCRRNFILAHGEASRVFREDVHDGQIGVTLLMVPAAPNSSQWEDVHAAETVNQMYIGSMLHPMVYGDYHQINKDLAGSKLPPFTEEQKAFLNDSVDFIGLNIYKGLKAFWKTPGTETNPAFELLLGKLVEDMPDVNTDLPSFLTEQVQFFEGISPEVLHDGVLWTWQAYGKPIAITENGFGDVSGRGKKDHLRGAYFSSYLRKLISTINEFRVKVIMYCAWSLTDNFEWTAEYSRSFGVVHVDFQNKSLPRTIKESGRFWIELADSNRVPLVEATVSAAASSSSVHSLVKASILSIVALVFGLFV